jgi:DoxX-like family
VSTPERRALVLAGLQAADLAITQLLPAYGDEHLDHLGVPPLVRRALPIIKAAAVGALMATARRPILRGVVGAGLISYYSAAVAFHVRAGDRPVEAAPAAACALLAATIV